MSCMGNWKERARRRALEIIRKRGKITVYELAKILSLDFPKVENTKVLGFLLRDLLQKGEIYKWRDCRNRTWYSREPRITKKCLFCGKPTRRGKFCSDECEKEYEKIVNFYIPLPF